MRTCGDDGSTEEISQPELEVRREEQDTQRRGGKDKEAEIAVKRTECHTSVQSVRIERLGKSVP